MYPYYYPNYFNPAKASTGAMPTGIKTPTASPTVPMAPATPTTPGAFGTTSGMPTESVAPAPPTIHEPMVDFDLEPGAPVITSTEYTQGYLRSQIGKKVRVEFLIGTNLFTDRTGVLVGVGISYILLRLQETDDIMLCDIYSIKFVTFLL